MHLVGGGLLAKQAIAFIYGPAKARKSWLLMSLLLDVSLGRPVWGAHKRTNKGDEWVFPVNGGPKRVLYLDQELGLPDMQERMAQLVQGLTPPDLELAQKNFFIRSLDHQMSLDKPEGVAAISKVIEAVQPVDVVGFDTWVEFFSSVDENKAQDVTLVMRHLDYLREKFGFASVFCAHTSKVEGRKGLDRLRGSTAIAGKLNTAIELTGGTRDQLRLSFIKRSGKPVAPLTLEFDPNMYAKFLCWGVGRPKDSNNEVFEAWG